MKGILQLASNMTTSFESLSNALSENIVNTSRSVVAVQGRHSSGTGIHWRQGLIVTSCEAINAGDSLHLTLPDGKTVETEILGSDPTTDVAILSLAEAVDLPTATIGDAQALALGQLVSTVGQSVQMGGGRSDRTGRRGRRNGRRSSAQSAGQTDDQQAVQSDEAHNDQPGSESSQAVSRPVTQFASLGIVSQIGGDWRSQSGGQLDRYIVVNLNLRRGSAGCPLIDAKGEVVGFNTFGPRRSVLTIPATTIDRVVDQLQQRGKVSRGYLGLGMQMVPLPENVRSQHDISNEAGIMVVSVDPDSAADRAGMVLGDVMLTINDTPLSSLRQMQAMLNPQSVGQALSIQLLRGGQLQTTDVVVGER